MHDVMKVLASPLRREILRFAWSRERSAGEIAANFAVSWPAVSQHLRILREAGFLQARRNGRYRLYRADVESLGDLAHLVGVTHGHGDTGG